MAKKDVTRDPDEGKMTLIRYRNRFFNPTDFIGLRIQSHYNEVDGELEWSLQFGSGLKIYTAPTEHLCNKEFARLIVILEAEGIDIIEIPDVDEN